MKGKMKQLLAVILAGMLTVGSVGMPVMGSESGGGSDTTAVETVKEEAVDTEMSNTEEESIEENSTDELDEADKAEEFEKMEEAEEPEVSEEMEVSEEIEDLEDAEVSEQTEDSIEAVDSETETDPESETDAESNTELDTYTDSKVGEAAESDNQENDPTEETEEYDKASRDEETFGQEQAEANDTRDEDEDNKEEADPQSAADNEAAAFSENEEQVIAVEDSEEESVSADAVMSEVASGTCGYSLDILTWVLDDEGTLTISGTGRMKDYSTTSYAPWNSYKEQITSIVVSNGVTTIGGCAFRGCTNLTSVMIPDSVTGIGGMAFSYCSSLTSVMIPNSVQSIGIYAFSNCSNLTSVKIPDSVTIMYHCAFRDCENLKNVTIGNGLTKITERTFDGCSNLTSVKIPAGVTSIENDAFIRCISLMSVTIPDSVTSIGSEAFYSCSSLTSVKIPANVTSIGAKAFFNCSSLTSIDVVSDNSNFTSVDGVLLNKNKTTLIQYPIGKNESSYTIPDSVTDISSYAFYNCSSLTSATIPESVKNVGYGAFYQCGSLKNVTIANSVTGIGDYAFRSCGNLTSVTIGDSVTSIGEYTFYDCPNLINYTVNDYVINYCKSKKVKCNYPRAFYPNINDTNVDYTHPIRIVFDKYVIGNNGYAYLYEVGKEEPVDSILLSDDYVSGHSIDSPRNNLKLVFENIVNGNECIDSGKSYYIEIEENAIKLSDADPNELNNNETDGTEEQVFYPFLGIYLNRWSFNTINLEYAFFKNPNNNEISKDLFRNVFKAPIITNKMYNKEDYRNPGGICTGMAYVSGAKKNNFELASQFRKLYSYAYNDSEMISGGFTISDYMKMAYIYQKIDEELQEVIDTTNEYSDIVNAIKSSKQIIIHIWKKKNIFGAREGQHALLPIRIVDETDAEIRVQVYDCNGVYKQYDDSRFAQKSFLNILTFKKKNGSIDSIEYYDDNRDYSGKYDCIAMTTLDDKFEQLIKSNSDLSSYEEYYQGHPLLRIRQDYDLVTHPFQYIGDLIPIFTSNGNETEGTEESEENLYWVNGSSFEDTLTEDNTFSITDGYDEIEVTASSGASIGLDIENNTAKIENTDASSQDYIITHTRAEDDDNTQSIIINGVTPSAVNSEKTEDGIVVNNEDGTPVEVEISIKENDEEISTIDVIATTSSINVAYDDSNILTVTEDTDSDGTYETVIATSEEILQNVTFDANGGVINSETDDVTDKEVVNAESVTKRIKDDSYAFIASSHVQNDNDSLFLYGWSLTPDGQAVITFNEGFNPDGDCTLYAVWKRGKHTGDRLYGDSNDNGTIDSGDSLRIERHIQAEQDSSVRANHPDWIMTGYDYEASDINHDTVISSADADLVRQSIAAQNSEDVQAEHPDWILTGTFAVYSFEDIQPRLVTGITLNSSEMVLEKGTSATLMADIVPTDADDPSVEWSSNNDEVATVDDDGNVTAVAEGKATITVTARDGSGVYATCEVTVTTPVISITEATVTGISTKTYTGKALTQTPVVKLGTTTLSKDTDYTLSYSNNTNAGTATVTITGIGNYEGTKTVTFTINKAAQSITASNLTLTYLKTGTIAASGNKGTLTYQSSNTAVATVDSTGKVTAKGAGTAKITITAAATSNYNAATKTITVTVAKAAQSIKAKSSAASVAVGKTATVSITGAKGTKSFKSSDTTIATVTSAGTVTARKVGTVKITATSAATTNYKAASKTVTIKVVPAATASLIASNLGTGMKLTWKKVAGATGYKVYRGSTLIKTITSGSTVTFADAKANTNGTKYTFKVVATASTGISTLSKSVSYYRIARPAISSATNTAAGRATVKWGKNATATGYQIQYSLSNTFASGNKTLTLKGAATVSRVIASLTKGKTYYIRMRTYKTVGSTNYWSLWSTVKAVKISK